MIERLGQPHRPAEVEQAQQAARETEAVVCLVLGAARRVVAACEIALGALALVARGAEGSDHQEQGRLERDHDKQQLVDRVGGKRVQDRRDQRRIGSNGIVDRPPFDDVVDDDLDRPGKHQHRYEAREHQGELDGEASLEGADVAEGTPNHPQGLPRGQELALLYMGREAHRLAASAAICSASTRAR